MQTLLFDLLVTQPNKGSKFHGGGEYIKTLFCRLCEFADRIRIIAVYNDKAYLDPLLTDTIESCRIEAVSVADHGELERSGLFDRVDIYLCGLSEPIINMTLPEKLKVITFYHNIRSLEKPIDITSYLYSKQLTTAIKDIIRYLAGDRYRSYEKKKVGRAFEKSSYIVGVSISAVSSVDLFFPEISEEKKLMVYAPLKNTQMCESPSQTGEKYILMLGGDRWVKNAYRGMTAIDRLFDTHQLEDVRVKIVGEVSNRIKRSIHHKEKFDYLNYVDPSELETLYRNCEIFFYPTMNEGFGYPPLEAMRYGKTCVVSSASSLPEIYGNSVYYCNPYDRWEMMARVLYALHHKKDGELLSQSFRQITEMSSRSVDDFINWLVSGKV